MTRLDNWPGLLIAFIDTRRDEPFCWGINDCCAFAARAVEAITGVDVFAPWAEYADAASAARLVQAAGGVDAIADRVLGERIAPSFAQRGDVMRVEIEGRQSLAVCVGAVCAAPGVETLQFLQREEATCAWRV